MLSTLRTCLFATLLAFPALAWAAAQEPPELITDRPDRTESSAVVPRGFVQVETGLTYTDAERDSRSISVPETLVRVGIYERLELRLGFAGWTHGWEGDGPSGFGDGELGFKLYLMSEEDWRPETALLASVSLPIGEEEHSSERFDPAFRFSFSHTLAERLSLGYNLGVAWETEENVDLKLLPQLYNFAVEEAVGSAVERGLGAARALAPFHEHATGLLTAPLLARPHTDRDTLATFQYTATLGIGLTSRWGIFVEFFGDVPLNASGSAAHGFDGGFTYLVRDNIQWDLACGVGLNDAADDWFIGTGLSVRIP